MKFEVGQKYSFIHRSGKQQHYRETIAVYLGQKNQGGAVGDCLILSARPVAGTQELPLAWLEGYRKVRQDTTPVVNRVRKATDFYRRVAR